jgi:activator of 2-hydroxyglutaryl-CoA dehydratase
MTEPGAPSPRTEPVFIGIDVGSTTVKAVVVDPVSHQILWSDYQRHQTKQAEKVLELLVAIGNAFPHLPEGSIRSFITGRSSPGRARVRWWRPSDRSSCRR